MIFFLNIYIYIYIYIYEKNKYNYRTSFSPLKGISNKEERESGMFQKKSIKNREGYPFYLSRMIIISFMNLVCPLAAKFS